MEEQKLRQVEYHEREHYDAHKPRAIDNSHPLVAWLNTCRLRQAVEMIGEPLAGKEVLSVCGGDGDEADFLERCGARVTVTDLSRAGVQAAARRNPRLRSLCMDTERLAFPDGSFDWVFVRDGLHHLARPLKGLYELERVSREGFAILEGQDSWMVRLLVRLGFGEDWDPAGGYTYRFTRRELRKVFFSVQTVESWCLRTTWLPPGSDLLRYFPFVTRYVHPVISNPSVYRLLTSGPGRRTLVTLFRGLNLLAGRWGNSLVVVARKKAA